MQDTNIESNPPAMRVLHVIHGFSVGGAETWLIALLRHYAALRAEGRPWVRMDVLVTGGEPQILDAEARSLGAELYYIKYSQREIFQFSKGLRSLLRSKEYRVIHDHQGCASGIHFLCGVGKLPPVRVAHIHNPYYDIEEFSSIKTRVLVPLQKSLVARFATHVMGTSVQMIHEYGFDHDQFRRQSKGAAHCGFDVSDYRRDKKSDFNDVCHEFSWRLDSRIVLFAGRIGSDTYDPNGQGQSRKNPEFALRVARLLFQRDPRARLLLAGAGNATIARLRAVVSEWGLSDRIRFTGARSDIPRLMNASRILLFPTLAEGLGMVAVEAQAAGLRILASDSVPRECVVVQSLVRFLALSEGAEVWAEQLAELIDLEPMDAAACNRAVSTSAFSIENSAGRLMEIYSGATAYSGKRSIGFMTRNT